MAKSTKRKPKSFDVAGYAGVSRSGVSQAFTPISRLASETRSKVTKLAEELGYRVSHLALGLQKNTQI